MDFIPKSLNNLAHNDSAPLPKIMNVPNGWVVNNTPLFFASYLITLKNGRASFHFVNVFDNARPKNNLGHLYDDHHVLDVKYNDSYIEFYRIACSAWHIWNNIR